MLHPNPVAHSGWDPDQVRGAAITGALARAAELVASHRPDLRPVRSTFELFRPVRMAPLATSATLVREGRRLCLVDSEVVQEGRSVARGRTLLLATTAEPTSGSVWSPSLELSPPPVGLPPGTEGRLYFSEDVGWSASPTQHQNAARKQIWHLPVPVVDGERPSPFQAAASVADMGNLVTSWGSSGLQHINADVTLALAQLPLDGEVGLSASGHVESNGIAVGTATVFDRTGTIGSAMVTALVNSHRAVDTVARLAGRE